MEKEISFDLGVSGGDHVSAGESQQETPEISPAFSIKDSAPATKSRLSFALNNDGTIDFASMRQKNRDALRQAFTNDPAAARELGLIKDDTTSAVHFDDKFVDSLYEMLGAFEGAIVSKWKKVPPAVTAQIFEYSKSEKDLLRQPTATVLAKYAPASVVKFQDEIQLGMLMLAIHRQKLEALTQWTIKQNAAALATSQPQPRKPNGDARKQEREIAL